jgi:hypothetical protein
MSTEPVVAEVVEAAPPPVESAPRGMVRYTSGGIQIATMADAIAWADSVIRSGFAPRGFNKASQVIVAAQTGHELGLGPAASLRALYVAPSGKPTLYAESAHALVAKSGQLEDWKQEITGTGDDLSATYHVKRKGMAWKSATFSVADARRAGLVKSESGWSKYPERMVLARAKAFAYHDVFPDVLLGVAIEGDGADEGAGPEPVAAAPPIPPPPSGPDPLLAGATEEP